MSHNFFDFENNKFLDFSKKTLTYLVVIYVFIILSRVIWNNWNLTKQINQLKSANAQLAEQNLNLQNLIVYYGSSSFQELEARDKLGLKLPDEKVVMVPVRKIDPASNPGDSVPISTPSRQMPNYQAWWSYIFD
jgi:cell division protein FtsB